jgi:hypothetical protein
MHLVQLLVPVYDNEVMVERLDPEWWAQYRRELEGRFAQDEMVVRAQEVRRL